MKDIQQRNIASPTKEYIERLHEYMLLYQDASRGRHLLVKETNEYQSQIKKLLPKDKLPVNIDSLTMTYATSDPDDPNGIIIGHTTQRQLKERNSDNGINAYLQAHSIIVLAYAIWDAHYRKLITHELNEQKEIDINSIGELRRFRHDIIHNKGICSLEHSAKNKIFNWFNEGEQLTFTSTNLVEIFFSIKEELLNAYTSRTGKTLSTGKFLTRAGHGHKVIR
jgi:hypothetical protein